MAYILATEEFRLSRRYGGICWSNETGQVYAVPERGDDPEETARKVYLATNGEETEHISLADILGTTPIRCAQFVSGQFCVLVESNYMDESGWGGLQSVVLMFNNDGSYSGEMRLWDGIGSFARRHEESYLTWFFQGAGDGNIVRWATSSPHTPEKTNQFLPWRAEAGNVRGMDFDGPEIVPGTWLVAAHESGKVVWLDVSLWTNDLKSMVPYKSFGLAQCRDISDICLDRANNRLYVLDSGQRLLRYDLEPFGTEATGYHNTPKELMLKPSSKTVTPGGEITITGEFLDMWSQRLQYAGIPYEMISGNARGKFLEGSTWKTKARGTTGSDGRFTATYKANAS